ncbi:MAG: DinB family protein [Planctomycetes bacterium]|nr:DinB family protein [Planctomycetota bacterium]
MNVLELIRNQFAYDAWARAQFVAVLRTLNDEEFIRPLGPGLDSFAAKFTHLIDSDDLWLGRIDEGVNPPIMPYNKRFKTVADFMNQIMVTGHRKAKFLMDLTEEALDHKITYTNTHGKTFSQPLHELLQHLLLHGQYHRGQMASCLRALGKQPPETDIVVYYRQAQGPTK